MKIVFLLTVFWIQRYKVIGAPNCCTSKNVGGLEYTLLKVEDTSQYNCLTNCVYEKVGDPVPGRTYCFGAGDLKVECTGEGDPIICDDELKSLHGSLSASNNTFGIDCCDNGMTTHKTTCGNGTDCATVCGVIPTCAKVVTDPEEGKEYCSNSKTNTRDGRANNNPQMVVKSIGSPSCKGAVRTTCNMDIYGVQKPPTPNFCSQNTYYVIDFTDRCCGCKVICEYCDPCCSPMPTLEDHLIATVPEKVSQVTNPIQSSSYTIEWKRGMNKRICVSPGTNITFNWEAGTDHNVIRISPEAWWLCNVTGYNNEPETGPFNLGPALDLIDDATWRFYFTSGYQDDCQIGNMKVEIAISNDCNDGEI